MPSLQQQMPSPGIPLNLPVISGGEKKKKEKGNSSAITGTLSGKELEVRTVYFELALSKSSCVSLDVEHYLEEVKFPPV